MKFQQNIYRSPPACRGRRRPRCPSAGSQLPRRSSAEHACTRRTVLIIGIGGGVTTIALHIARAARYRAGHLVLRRQDRPRPRVRRGRRGQPPGRCIGWPQYTELTGGAGVDVVVNSVARRLGRQHQLRAPGRAHGGVRRHRSSKVQLTVQPVARQANVELLGTTMGSPRNSRACSRPSPTGVEPVIDFGPPAAGGGRGRARPRGGRRPFRQAGPVDRLAHGRHAASSRAARREVGAPAGGGRPSRLAPGAAGGGPQAIRREALRRAGRRAPAREPPEEPGGTTGHRSEIQRRADEALLGVDLLLLAGELVADGPRPPAAAGLRPRRLGGPSRPCAPAPSRPGGRVGGSAVAARPAADLGAAAPAALRGLRADPALAQTARTSCPSRPSARTPRPHHRRGGAGGDHRPRQRRRGAPDRLRLRGPAHRDLATADAAAIALWTEGLRRAAATPGAPRLPRAPRAAG